MTKIKFGTDGWRAIIAKEYTLENVARVAYSTAQWMKSNCAKKTIVIGHDCRFAGEMFAEACAKIMANEGVKVFLAKGFVSTPMVSLANVKLQTGLGIILTASHNPPEYGGFKIKADFGGPLQPEKVQEIEDTIPEKCPVDYNGLTINQFVENGLIEYVDLETMYVDQIKVQFDLEAIKKSGLQFAFDAMYGAGQNVMRRILPEVISLHCEYNPSFMGQAPEPIAKNLTEFSALIKSKGNIVAGLAIDGDADRIGLFNGKGEFVDSHHIMLLLINYLHKFKGLYGKVVVAASTTPRVERLCKAWNLPFDMVQIGFKHIAAQMVTEDVLVGGEESGGIAIKSHIPERDGIWMGLIIFEYMAKSGKTLDELVQEIYALVGEFKYWRDDLHLPESIKQEVIANCKAGKYTKFGPYQVSKTETIDGFRYIFNDDEWLMIRPSGTEPLLRAYAESKTLDGAFAILKAAKEELGIG
jgi:phosphomannomutase